MLASWLFIDFFNTIVLWLVLDDSSSIYMVEHRSYDDYWVTHHYHDHKSIKIFKHGKHRYTSSQNIRRTVLLLAIVLSADLGSTFHNHFRGFPRISSELIDTPQNPRPEAAESAEFPEKRKRKYSRTSPRIFPNYKRPKPGKWPVGIFFRRPRRPIIWRCLLCRPASSLINKSMKIVPCASILHQSIDMSNDKTYFNHARSFIDKTQFFWLNQYFPCVSF